MGLFSDVALGVRNPNLIARKLNQLIHTRGGRWSYNKKGIDIMTRDWDNLLILDACRLDMFGEQFLNSPVESVVSMGSGTIEFLQGNFDGRTLEDTVYVTANPQLHRHRDTISVNFHDVVNVWAEDGWNEDHGTVLPETVRERTIEAAERYPHKRLIVHFIQPHFPFVGSDIGRGHIDKEDPDELHLWMKIMTGEIPEEEIAAVVREYRSNLEIVVPHVEKTVAELEGKTVVTSDHGNMLGERSSPIPIEEWGHPLSLYLDELVRVPWVEFIDGERRDVIAERPEETIDDSIVEEVEDRLEKLGYR